MPATAKPGSAARRASVPRRARAAQRPGSGRAQRQAERREAILEAALAEFAASGFAAARLDDVARRAGVAKGTIYLHFRDKESLFQELVRAMLSPVVGLIETLPIVDRPVRAVFDGIVDLFVREIVATRRKDVIRLIITEGHRFPTLAEFYYREVISRVLASLRPLLARAAAQGELTSDAVVRFPQLLIAPALVALLWNGMFDRFETIEVRDLMRAHLDTLFAGRTAS